MSAALLARAKVNLTLHVTGQRPDGYHLLDSLVVFPEVGDLLEVEPSSRLSLTLDGPFGRDLATGDDNLVIRAAEAIRPDGAGAALRLTKNLPVASGIGGGSADAAAALSLLSAHWGVAIPDGVALRLGADVPVCLCAGAQRMQGIGEALMPVPLPAFWLVLVNRGVGVPTGAVFSGLPSRVNPRMPEPLPHWDNAAALAGWLGDMRNDLEAPAQAVEPGISDVLAALAATDGCQIARMSGSGGTCFGLFDDQDTALAASASIQDTRPDWWCVAAPVRESGSVHPVDQSGSKHMRSGQT